MKSTLFGPPSTWLEQPDELGLFPTNGDRWAAEIFLDKHSSLPLSAPLLQAPAVVWHQMTRERLEEVGRTVGRKRILVVHGAVDNVLPLKGARELVQGLGRDAEDGTEVKWLPMESVGHMAFLEKRREFAEAVNDLIGRVGKLEQKSGPSSRNKDPAGET